VNWVQSNAVHPAVATMSLGGGFSSSLNTAVTNLANSGVFIASRRRGSSTNATSGVITGNVSGTPNGRL
jgi:hypothetical protein